MPITSSGLTSRNASSISTSAASGTDSAAELSAQQNQTSLGQGSADDRTAARRPTRADIKKLAKESYPSINALKQLHRWGAMYGPSWEYAEQREVHSTKLRVVHAKLIAALEAGPDPTPGIDAPARRARVKAVLAAGAVAKAGAAVATGVVSGTTYAAGAVLTVPAVAIAAAIELAGFDALRITIMPMQLAHHLTFGSERDELGRGCLGRGMFRQLNGQRNARAYAERHGMSALSLAELTEARVHAQLSWSNRSVPARWRGALSAAPPALPVPTAPASITTPAPLPPAARTSDATPTAAAIAADLGLGVDELADAWDLQYQHDLQNGLGIETSSATGTAASSRGDPVGPAPLPSLRQEQWAASASSNPHRWEFAATENNAEAFNRFQARLTETAEYINVYSQPMMVARVDKLVSAMRASPELRGLCFEIADNALRECGDRIALGLNDMELAQIDFDAESGKYATHDLLVLAEGFFKLHVIDEIALTRINWLKAAGYRCDAVEVRLGYQKRLAAPLNLPGVTHSMLYPRGARLSVTDISDAKHRINFAMNSSRWVLFVAQWMPWKKAMERLHPEAYEEVRKMRTVERDRIAIQPVHMSEYEWMQAFDRLKARETDLFDRVTMRLTRKILATHTRQQF